jgi:hypothetical protein
LERICEKLIAIGTLATLMVASLMLPAWGADTATDTAQVKLQSATIPALRQSVASAAGYDLKSVELKHTAHQLTATLVNSKQNTAASADRETEALQIALAMQSGMADKPEYQGVSSIHIDYVSRIKAKVKTIQVFDFFRGPANAFVLHKT